MKIKFIVDKFKERDRKQLELIKKIIDEKPSKLNENALFLRKFTLAILHQYNKQPVSKEEIHEERLFYRNAPQAPHKISLSFNVAQAPKPINVDLNLEIPKKLDLCNFLGLFFILKNSIASLLSVLTKSCNNNKYAVNPPKISIKELLYCLHKPIPINKNNNGCTI